MGKRVILVGCGNMGYAMLRGWLDTGKLAPGDLTVVEPNEALRERSDGHGVKAVESVDAVDGADLVIFAVKPQVMRSVLPAYRRFAENAAFCSVAAGIGVAVFTDILGPQAAVIRCMPNTPAAIGKGMMVTFSNEHVTAETETFVQDLLSASGKVATVDDESLMDAVTAVSGSGPAYVFHFIECLTDAAEKAGLPSETARLLATQTVYGAACLTRESGEDPGKLREQVTSPNGTTAAALDVLMGDGRLRELMSEAVTAAKKRSVELGS
ncbi:pyrroline-5-carboxylate reductase [Chelativorans sp. YIM 93263]|uniref:pyrroline-5-carboxylate reductase n=1 Tax=Chelativorans sp. YIM 93263 TaxID=2906648 RepID=UPI002377FD70|nr:pyrroline-5-carboxylate reductase [Chelativorans sp. YIM 93263]